MSMCVFFFIKQKTADELRISDWSSDVCSSDLSKGERHTGGLIGLAACGYGGAPAPVLSPRRCRQRRGAGALDMPGAQSKAEWLAVFVTFQPRPSHRPMR